MGYRCKIESLSNDEVNRLTNACENFRERFVIWTFLDTGVRLSELAGLTKDNIQWQERKLVIYGKAAPTARSQKEELYV